MKPVVCSWSRESVKDPALQELLSILGEHYPIVENGPGLRLSAKLGGEGLTVSGAEIIGASVSMVARGVGALLSGIDAVDERTPFKRVGLLFDCCRNAVPEVHYLKEWLRRSALLGYNQMMLYTKDTYELPGEEVFGYLRGRYSAAELKELDAYAAKLGVEMVGSIQALGHLEPTLRWGRYAAIKDTEAELLTTEPKSYELVEKMLDFYSGVFRSRRIHLGMDETHGLGRGRYMDLNGYRRPFDIYIDHLNRVVAECDKRGLEPMIWSDMFFRMGSKNMDYYDQDAITPPDIIAKIPSQVKLSYWDYYHKDAAFYRDMIRRHRLLGQTPVMASGIWTWPVFWYNHRKTVETVRPCVEACAAEGVEEIVFTMWGDDGGYCDWSSAQVGACYAAEKCFNPAAEPSDALLERKFSALCDGDFQAHLVAAETTVFGEPGVSAAALLWDDPLLGIYRKDQAAKHGPDYWKKMEAHYAAIESKLKGLSPGRAGNVALAWQLAHLLKAKLGACRKVEQVYGKKDAEAYLSVQQTVARVATLVEDFAENYRTQWHLRNKTFGHEVMQIRLAGQAARWRELGRRFRTLAADDCDSIPELDETVAAPAGVNHEYRRLATASVYL